MLDSPKSMCWGHRFSDICTHGISWDFFFLTKNLHFKVNCFYWEGGIVKLGIFTSMESLVIASQGSSDTKDPASSNSQNKPTERCSAPAPPSVRDRAYS